MFKKKQGADSYSFFSVFSKERIGAGLFAFAAFVNLFCGLLLYLPSIRGFRPANSDNISLMDKLPIEFILASLLLTSYTIFLIIKAWTPVKMNLSRLLNTYLE